MAAASKPIGFVPVRHRWLPGLVAALQRASVATADAVLADASLRVTLLPSPRAPLVVVVRPRSQQSPGYAHSERFTIGFDGTSDLDPVARRALAKFIELFREIEPRVPAELDGFAAIAAASSSPERDLRRLFAFVDVERSRGEEGERCEVLVRATPACNQACPFCSAPAHREPDGEALLACFSAVARLLPGALLTLTGGEPTLRPSFLDELTAALELPGIGRVQVQSNAVGFAKKHDPACIRPDPRLGFFVSLHALDEQLYDACTGSRGQLRLALDGIRRLLQAGHAVTLNTVVSSLNLHHLDALARGVSELFDAPRRPRLHFSVLICPERRPDAARMLVRYRELAPVVELALASAARAGIDVEPLLRSTHASLPACVVSPEHRVGRTLPELGQHETGHRTLHTPWVKADGCARCVEAAHCLGVPRPYAERFGLEELAPLEGG
jgi:pyruvate-formate lyase-activating enzyme